VQDSEIVAHLPVAAVARQRAVPPGRLDRAWRRGTRRRYRAVVSIPATGYFFAWVRRQARATAAELIPAVAVGTVVAAVAIGFLFLPLTAAPVSLRRALKPRGTSPTRQSHRTPGPWTEGWPVANTSKEFSDCCSAVHTIRQNATERRMYWSDGRPPLQILPLRRPSSQTVSARLAPAAFQREEPSGVSAGQRVAGGRDRV
jgi:hypothetical protein